MVWSTLIWTMLPKSSAWCCDFYDITGGEWRTSDLLSLKTVMSTIDISPRGNIRYYDFIDRVAGDEKLLTKLLGGKRIQRLPETYLVPLLGIKKLELLDTDEAYIVDTVENSLQSARRCRRPS